MMGKPTVSVKPSAEYQKVFNTLAIRLGRDPTEQEIEVEMAARELHPVYGFKGYQTR